MQEIDGFLSTQLNRRAILAHSPAIHNWILICDVVSPSPYLYYLDAGTKDVICLLLSQSLPELPRVKSSHVNKYNNTNPVSHVLLPETLRARVTTDHGAIGSYESEWSVQIRLLTTDRTSCRDPRRNGSQYGFFSRTS